MDYAVGSRTRRHEGPADFNGDGRSWTWPRRTTTATPSACCWATATARSSRLADTPPLAPVRYPWPSATSTPTASSTWRRATTTLPASKTSSVLLGNGDGTFAPAVPPSYWELVVRGRATGDFNADGKLDLVYVGGDRRLEHPAPSNVLLGHGDGTVHARTLTSDVDAGDFTRLAVGRRQRRRQPRRGRRRDGRSMSAWATATARLQQPSDVVPRRAIVDVTSTADFNAATVTLGTVASRSGWRDRSVGRLRDALAT